MTTRNNSGGIQRLTLIPGTSAFAAFGGGAAAQCSFTTDRDDFLLSNGDRVPHDTRVTSTYHFVEGIAVPFDIPPQSLPADIASPSSAGPLEQAMRTFTVFCDRTYYDVNQIGIIQVPLLDPLLDPRTQIDRLRNLLQLDQPVVYTNPIVDVYDGLVTRYPTWLAIEPSAWQTQRSPAVNYRGTTILLIAQPRELEFSVDFAPNRDKPSPAFHGIVGCIPDMTATADAEALPALPVLPDQTEPGPNGPCMWTPPGPGSVTITARITYTITFWAGGFTQLNDDYTWESEPAVYDTGELIAVNTKP